MTRQGDLDRDETFVGNESTVRTFNISGTPTGTGYLVVTVYDLEDSEHRVLINGRDLGSFDIPKAPTANRWQTWMDRIESGVLRSGTNTIQLRRHSGEDNFVVRDVVVQWRRL